MTAALLKTPLTAADLPTVHLQYEALPYPERKPADEKQRLVQPAPSYLPNLVTNLYKGFEPDWNKWRVLDAGGGTGDATLFLAEQLKGTSAEIVYLDFSSASLSIAQERAKVRKLTNIRFIQASLLDLPKLDVGVFDYVVSSGVLHHLATPEDGLAAIKAVMKPEAALGLMLYAPHGRAPVYLLQNLFRRTIPFNWPTQKRIDTARKILNVLPKTHPWHFSGYSHTFRTEVTTDAGLYDLFLHSQDRPYSMEEVHGFLASAKLNLVYPLSMEGVQHSYNPYKLAPDASLNGLWDALDPIGQAAVAELLGGNLEKHTLFATTQTTDTVAKVGPDMIPYQSRDHAQMMGNLNAFCLQHKGQGDIFMQGAFGEMKLPLPPHAGLILPNWDGRKTFTEIAKAVCGMNPFLTEAEVMPILLTFHENLSAGGQSMLRHVSARDGLTARVAGVGGKVCLL